MTRARINPFDPPRPTRRDRLAGAGWLAFSLFVFGAVLWSGAQMVAG